jgi:hypothetical protein
MNIFGKQIFKICDQVLEIPSFWIQMNIYKVNILNIQLSVIYSDIWNAGHGEGERNIWTSIWSENGQPMMTNISSGWQYRQKISISNGEPRISLPNTVIFILNIKFLSTERPFIFCSWRCEWALSGKKHDIY